ncbi:MAG TPA: peptidase M16 [Gammaproteobacteria bacterium]|nr:peptidase M16 [Gammaproteobacteria bacterium]
MNTSTSEHGSAHPAFQWLRSETIASLNVTVEEYRHKTTGALHYHIAAQNPENVFLVALRTAPMDSTGVAHILEHTALCGSEHYPVRDPFFMMIRRSLNTFMNAFTSSDWTAYPFASKNRKDFNNLMDVYLDAVFFARLEELDFAQEGHRVEFETPSDPDSRLVFKGVVFNEMKGAMSSPVTQLWQYLSSHLFPTTTYHYNSGGDPEHIPDLTYEQLKAFYKTHYHPSNAIFMTYGDIPAREHQGRFEERALQRFQRLDETFAVPDEQRYAAPVEAREAYPLDPAQSPQDKTHLVMGWLLGRSTDLDELLKTHLLSSVLLDHGASPLRHALETTDLGSAPSPLCGIEDSNREMTFMCGLEGSRPENADALEALVTGVLQEVAEKGVPQDQVEAALHQLELSQREITGDGFPYGLQLILGALPAAVHRGDPVAMLNLDPILEKLHEEIKDPDFIKRLVREWLLDNPHRVRLAMEPDTELNQRREMAEALRLEKIKAGLSEAEKVRIIERAAQLEARQQQQDDPEILPKVGLEDIPDQLDLPRGEEDRIHQTPLTFFGRGTNGLVYQQIVVQLPRLEDGLLPDLPNYTHCITELGVGGRTYLETQAWQSAVSGGVNAYTSVRGRTDDVQAVNGYFTLSSKALARNNDRLSQLLQETLNAPRFDEHGRIREIIAQERARKEQSVTGHGHSLAMLAATSGMSPAAALAHRLRGLAGIRYLKELDDRLDQSGAVAELAARIEAIHHLIQAAPRQFLVICEEERRTTVSDALARVWSAVETPPPTGAGSAAFGLPPVQATTQQLWTTNTQVNFCARAYPTVPVDHPDAPALEVLGGFLRNGFLHRAIREQGGAYGGGASHDGDIAAFRFYSYRDPRLEETLADFDRAIDWLLDSAHEWRQVEEAILGVIGNIDKPGSPAGEAKDVFHGSLYGRTPEQRQAYRQRVLKVTLEDLQRVGALYLRPEKASTAVITNSMTLEQTGGLGMEVLAL